jgi:hypothetical protein
MSKQGKDCPKWRLWQESGAVVIGAWSGGFWANGRKKSENPVKIRVFCAIWPVVGWDLVARGQPVLP